MLEYKALLLTCFPANYPSSVISRFFFPFSSELFSQVQFRSKVDSVQKSSIFLLLCLKIESYFLKKYVKSVTDMCG